MKVCATVPIAARTDHHHEGKHRMSDITAFDRYRAARASLLIGITASPAPRDLGVIHGPSIDCGCDWGRLCDFHANDCASIHPTHNGRCWAAWQTVGVRLHGRDAIDYARMDTARIHGPAIAVRLDRALRPGMDGRRGWAADRAYSLLVDMGAAVTWRREYDTGRVHGPMTAKVASLQDAAERFERADALSNRAMAAGPWMGHRVSGSTRTV